MNSLPVASILVPLGFALGGILVNRFMPRALRGLLMVGALALALVHAALALHVLRHGPQVYLLGGWEAPLGITLVIDELGALFLLLIGCGMSLALLLSLSTHAAEAAGLGILLNLLAAALTGLVATGDLFNLFVFVELTTIGSIGLVARKRTAAASAQAFVYLLYASLSGFLLLLAIILLYGSAGTLNMAQLAALAPDLPLRVTGAVLASVTVSFGIKIALVPLHFWQANTYDAAGGTSAGVLSGVVMSCSIYGLTRVVWTVLEAGGAHADMYSAILLTGGGINILTGHILALHQVNIKRMLAFSSVAHTGYILLGLGLGSRAGVAAALLHTWFHMVMKTAAFWSARAFIESAGSAALRRMRGVAAAAPVSFTFFIIAVIALVGIPPTHGFASKWLLARAAMAQDRLAPVLVIALGTIISLGYYARFFILAIQPAARSKPLTERCRGALLVLLLLTIGCLAGGFATAAVLPWFERAAEHLLDPSAYYRLLFPEGR